ncbi:universal stress protein [Halomarina ordinaria]|uniref:Universal stress protein n=1 Tax=Halomarina ordinaria TaxID=3033939 RepID=A0ABD5U8J9_9EURY|nr:universal stress protein [Halomarina sp. PSRA2]
MYDSILVPTDGSDHAEAAVDEALDLAAETGATLHVLYVLDVRELSTLPEEQWLSVEEALDDVGDRAVGRVEERAEEVGVSVTTAVEPGIPSETIVDYAGDNDVDLVVMSTHGRTGLSHLLLGSVAEKVVRRSPVPVLVVRPEAEEE